MAFLTHPRTIKNKLREGVVEPAPATVTGREFYIPHKAVVRENAQVTKVRIVNDASSAREGSSHPSLKFEFTLSESFMERFGEGPALSSTIYR